MSQGAIHLATGAVVNAAWDLWAKAEGKAVMAHVRRKLVDIHRSQGSPIAEEAIGRIAQLYAVEKETRGSPPDVRLALRKAHAARSLTIRSDGLPCNSP